MKLCCARVVAVAALSFACGPAAEKSSVATPLATPPPAVPAGATAAFEGEIEYALTTQHEEIYPADYRRDVLRAAHGRARWTGCAMGAGCGPVILDRPANRLWLVLDEPKMYIEHELSVFLESVKVPGMPEPGAGGRRDTFKETGKTSVIASIPCREIVQPVPEAGNMEACATRASEFAELNWAIGTILLSSPPTNMFSTFANAGWFPLRVRFMGTEVVAVRVSRQRVADSVFAPPPGSRQSKD